MTVTVEGPDAVLELSGDGDRAVLRRITTAPSPVTVTWEGLNPDRAMYWRVIGEAAQRGHMSPGGGTGLNSVPATDDAVILVSATQGTIVIAPGQLASLCGTAALPGTYSATAGVCTLSADAAETVELDDPGQTLDCAGHEILGGNYDNQGLAIGPRATGAGVKRCTIRFGIGIQVFAEQVRLEQNRILSALGPGSVGIQSSWARQIAVRDNSIADAVFPVIVFGPQGGPVAEITGNTITNGHGGVFFGDSSFAATGSVPSWEVTQARIAGNTIASTAHGMELQIISAPPPGQLPVRVEGNTLTGLGMRINWLGPGPGPRVLHNNVHGSLVSWNGSELPVPFDASFGGEGNFWGRTALPLFVPGVDSNDIAVVDSHAYCAQDGWNTGYSPGSCTAVTAPPAPTIQDPGGGGHCYSATIEMVSGVLPTAVTGTVRVFDFGFPMADGPVSGTTFNVALNEPLGEGAHELTASVVVLGMESPLSEAVSLVIDQGPPAGPVVFTAGPHATLPALELTGSAEPGSYVLAWLDADPRPTTAAAQADVSGLFGPALVGPAANGAHTLHVQVADCAMNLSPEVQRAVLLQYVSPPPPAPVIESPAGGTTHAVVTFVSIRTAEAGVIAVTDNNAPVPTSSNALPAGPHTIAFPAPLLPGAHVLRAWLVREPDGVLSDSSLPVAFRVDPTPSRPVITDPAPGSIHATPVARVSGITTGTGVTLFEGTTQIAEAGVIEGRFVVFLSPSLGKGIHTLEAIAHVETPVGRMFSAPTFVKFSVIPNELDVPVVKQPVAGQTSLAPLVAASGEAAPGATLLIALDGEVKAKLTVQPDGRWAGVLSGVTPGTHRLTASATLRNMGSPTTSPVEFTVVAAPDPAQVIEDSSGKVGFSVKSVGQPVIDLVDQQKSTTVYGVKFRAMPANTQQRRAFTVMRESYTDLDTGEVFANVAAVQEHGSVANAQEDYDAIMAYDGRGDTDGYPFEVRRLRRVSWVETAYVTNTPAASCTALADSPPLVRAFQGVDFTQLRRPGQQLSYCVAKQTSRIDLGDLVVVIGIAESPEGWLSQLKRASADLQRFADRWGWDLNAPLPTERFPPDPLPQVGRGRPQAQLNLFVEPVIALADLRFVRTFGQHLDTRLCQRQTPAVHCELDLRACGVPAGCRVDVDRGPEPDDIVLVDWTDCTGETCEEVPRPDWQCHCSGWRCSCGWVTVMVRLEWTCRPTGCHEIGRVPGPWVCGATCDQGAPPGACGDCDIQMPELDCNEPRPVETGYAPVARENDGNERVQLAHAAEEWEEFTERHIIDGQYLGGEIDPRLGENLGFFSMTRYHDRRNSTGVTAEVAAARAYKFGVTHSAQDREKLRQSMVALHAMMTVANDPITWDGGGADQHPPDGHVIDPNDPQCNVTRETRDGGPSTQVGYASFVERDHCDNPEGSPTPTLLPDGTVLRFPDGGPVLFDPPDITDAGAVAADCACRPGVVRRGIWPRSLVPGWYERELRPEFVRDMFEEGQKVNPEDIAVIAETTYGFQGGLPAFNTLQSSPQHPEINRYRFILRASRDIVDTMMFAVSAARTALGPDDDLDGWMTDVGGAVGDFMMALIDHGYTMIDIDDQPTPFGRMLPPVPDEGAEFGDPTQAFEVLAWLRTCARVAPGPWERQRCRDEYARVMRQWVILPNQQGGGGFPSYVAAGSVLFSLREVLHAGTTGGHHRPFLIALAVQTLLERDVRMDTLPEEMLGTHIIADFWKQFGTRMFSFRRVPFFDTLTVFANGGDVEPGDFEPSDGDSTRARVGAILRQYPSPRYRPLAPNDRVSPSTFVAPRLAAPACATLRPRAPFCTTPLCENLNKLSFRGCDNMRNQFVTALGALDRRLVPDENAVDSIWALGQGLAMPLDIADGNRSYMLQEGDTCDDNSRGGILEPYGYGFLLAYWHAVFHNTVRLP
ncbi:MAG: hypothetical protein HY904_12215 [Deltaproteobacteria bacterium]|nr:hypothetical protein [Deltaproteobacteria bacterium]